MIDINLCMLDTELSATCTTDLPDAYFLIASSVSEDQIHIKGHKLNNADRYRLTARLTLLIIGSLPRGASCTAEDSRPERYSTYGN
jgi:hypothetical protein